MTLTIPTREDVGKVARALITLNGETTTLDVKKALRKVGFFATQDVIRNHMLDITSKDGDVKYEETGRGYRRYLFATPLALDDDDDDDDSSVSQPATAPFAFGSGNIPHRDLRIADYAVFDRNGGNRKFYRGVNRRQARHKWAASTGLKYAQARTKKYKPA